MSIIIFLIILAALVLVHEFGHFIVAKKSGIRVDEFGLGFPPKLWSKRFGETTYSLNLIPFGGFVKIHGENPDEESTSGPDSGRSFVNKPRHIQALVLIAGILFNIIFAWLLLSASFLGGIAASSEDYAVYASRISDARIIIIGTTKDSPAETAGLKAGDRLLALRAGTMSLAEPLEVENIQEFISSNKNKEVTVTYSRGDERKEVSVTPQEGLVPDRAIIGVSMDKAGTLQLPFHLALYEGGRLTIHMVKGVSVGLFQFIWGAVRGGADLTSVSGPVGIVGLVGDATKLGFTYLLSFTALISINLAIINLIPFPALDGGRLLFVAIESIIRRAINPKISNTVNAVGFSLLLFFMLFITYKDIVKLFT
ncbi:MAG TPA: M50 family metallopeptidase [Candidatus Paceibacterota bacterium]